MSTDSQLGIVACAGLQLDIASGTATRAGRSVALTGTEQRLLAVLMAEPERVFSRAELIEAGVVGNAVVLERTIDVHVGNLRRKLADPPLIDTVRRRGYRFREAVS